VSEVIRPGAFGLAFATGVQAVAPGDEKAAAAATTDAAARVAAVALTAAIRRVRDDGIEILRFGGLDALRPWRTSMNWAWTE
jgi:hypothetical protein